MVTTRSRAPSVRFGAASPIVPLHEPRSLPYLKTYELGQLTTSDGLWFISSSQSTSSSYFINGVEGGEHEPLAHGDVLEKSDGAWVVAFDGAGLPDSGLGPLWRAWRRGVFSLTRASPHRWHGLLRGGTYAPGVDSLERLRAVLESDLAWSLETLELHASSNEAVGNWADFAIKHLDLAQNAPFALALRTPVAVEVPGVEPLRAVTCEGADQPALQPFGLGSRWDFGSDWVRGRTDEHPGGWMTLAPGDPVPSAPGLSFFRAAAPAAAEQEIPTEAAAVTPWVLDPAHRGEHRPLVRAGGDWVYRDGDEVTRWAICAEGGQRRMADETLAELSPWFHEITRSRRSSVVLLPGESRFLSGSQAFPPERALTLQAVCVFTDELLAANDVAAEGLAAIARSTPDAQAWLRRLLAPFAREPGPNPNPLDCGIDLEHSEHTGGFFTRIRLQPWLDLEKDVHHFVCHPLLCRLQRLELVRIGPAAFARVQQALALTGRPIALEQIAG